MRVAPITDDEKKIFRHLMVLDIPKLSDKGVYFGLFDDNDDPVGTAVVDEDGEEVVLESLFIAPEQRRKGYGSRFIHSLIEARREVGGVFVSAEFRYSNEAARAFFLSCGFLLTKAVEIYYFWQKKVIKNQKARKVLFRDSKKDCRSVKMLSRQEKNLLRETIKKMGHEDIYLDMENFQPDLSSCVFDSKGNLLAFLLCSEYDNDIIVNLMGGMGKNAAAVPLTFRHVLEALIERDENGTLPDDGKVIFEALQAEKVDMAENIFEGEIESDDFVVKAIREL